MKSGMKYLIQAFYESITANTSVPIPYREILMTARIMDSIFAQIYDISGPVGVDAPNLLAHNVSLESSVR